MTRDQQIADIRAACIKANPQSWDCGAPCHCSDGRLTVRLADVLLAIGSREGKFLLGGRLAIFYTPNGKELFSWRTHLDDLTEQSDECISFLAELLK
jgi:hypothetical protein